VIVQSEKKSMTFDAVDGVWMKHGGMAAIEIGKRAAAEEMAVMVYLHLSGGPAVAWSGEVKSKTISLRFELNSFFFNFFFIYIKRIESVIT